MEEMVLHQLAQVAVDQVVQFTLLRERLREPREHFLQQVEPEEMVPQTTEVAVAVGAFRLPILLQVFLLILLIFLSAEALLRALQRQEIPVQRMSRMQPQMLLLFTENFILLIRLIRFQDR
jgi:hypothetical protein